MMEAIAFSIWVNTVAFDKRLQGAVCTCVAKEQKPFRIDAPPVKVKACLTKQIYLGFPEISDGPTYQVIALYTRDKNGRIEPTQGTVRVTCLKPIQ